MNKTKLIKYIKQNAIVNLYQHPEHIPIKGNCSAIDDETDAAAEKWLEEQLKCFNHWAWCSVEVVVQFEQWVGKDYLGCCSYKSEEDFKKGGYYQDMIDNCIYSIAEEIQRDEKTLKTIKANY